MFSKASITISPGQALLILIDNAQVNSLKEIEDELERLYLTGADNEMNEQRILQFIQEGIENGILSGYRISNEPEDINKDASRRYFESHLAYETLVMTLPLISIVDLNVTRFILSKLIPEEYLKKMQITKKVIYAGEKSFIFNGISELIDPNLAYFEFISAEKTVDLIDPDSSNNATEYMYYQSLRNEEDRRKLKLLFRLAQLNLDVMCQSESVTLPFNIYRKSMYFLEENRGREAKEQQSEVKSTNLGVLTSLTPVPKNDIVSAREESSYVRHADRSFFIKETLWVKDFFSKQVHPFCSSISGSLLVQLRVFIYLQQTNALEFDSLEKMAAYLKCFTSALLFNSGGHSFYEYFAVLALPEVKSEFAFLKSENPSDKSLKNISDFTMTELLLKQNEVAFDKALNRAISYNKHLLRKAKLHQSIPMERNLKSLQNRIEMERENNSQSLKLQKQMQMKAKLNFSRYEPILSHLFLTRKKDHEIEHKQDIQKRDLKRLK